MYFSGTRFTLYSRVPKLLTIITIWVTSSEKVSSNMRKMQIQIILRMSKVSFMPLLSIDTLYRIQWYCERTVKAQIRLRIRTVWSRSSCTRMPRKYIFCLERLYLIIVLNLNNSICYTLMCLKCVIWEKNSRVYSGCTLFPKICLYNAEQRKNHHMKKSPGFRLILLESNLQPSIKYCHQYGRNGTMKSVVKLGVMPK